VANRGRQIARATQLPAIIDADTGFGEVLNVARTIQELIEMGLAGCHLEDQTLPKRCGHLDGKSLVSTEDMVRKIKIAAEMKRDLDPNFLLIARTDARASEGLPGAIRRAEAYLKAGADMIFPEALTSLEEFHEFKKQTGALVLANMTEFGKSPLWSLEELTQAGANIVIYPVSLLRVSMKATEMLLADIKKKGHQRDQLPHMQTRAELYDLTAYAAYNQWDQNIFNFTLNPSNKE
jgi:methylisocitrate lyase